MESGAGTALPFPIVLLKYAQVGFGQWIWPLISLAPPVPQRGHSILPVSQSSNDISILLTPGYIVGANRVRPLAERRSALRQAFRGTVGENETDALASDSSITPIYRQPPSLT